MTSREEREKRRAERLAAEQAEKSAARRRLMIGYVVAGGLALAVVVGLGVVIASGGGSGDGADGEDLPANAHIQVNSGYIHDVRPDGREGTPPPALEQGDLEKAAAEAGCELRLELPDEGSQHISKESEIPDYETNPPTSGNHYPEQQADGAYAAEVSAWYFLHSMEHGRIAVQYSPDLSEADQLALKGVFDESPPAMLLFPYGDMPYEVAVTAWTELMTCKKYEGRATLDAIRDFRETYRGFGPEQVPMTTG